MTCCGVFGGYALCWAACAYRVAAVPGRGGGVAWCMLGICPDSIPLTSTGPTTCWRGCQYPTWRPATERSRSRCCTAIRGRGPPDRPPLAPDPALRRTEPPRRVAPGVRQAQPSTRPRGRTGLGSRSVSLTTAPIDASSGNQNRHRLSRAGNRRINRTLHIMAIVHPPTTPKAATTTAADSPPASPDGSPACPQTVPVRCCLPAHAKRLATGPGGHVGATLQSSAADPNPKIDNSEKSLPGPAEPQPRADLAATT
jgi:hypothetical protein